MKTPKKPRFPKHLMGKWCGYDLFEDGSIEPAQSHWHQMEEALRDEGEREVRPVWSDAEVPYRL